MSELECHFTEFFLIDVQSIGLIVPREQEEDFVACLENILQTTILYCDTTSPESTSAKISDTITSSWYNFRGIHFQSQGVLKKNASGFMEKAVLYKTEDYEVKIGQKVSGDVQNALIPTSRHAAAHFSRFWNTFCNI